MHQVDQTGLKTGQALTILLLAAAFVINGAAAPVLVGFVALAQLLGALNAPFAPYKIIYQAVVRRLVRPNLQPDHAAPHRFALLIGALFNGTATLALLLGAPTLAWALVGIVVVLANLNFWVSFCAGCWMYYQFNRLGVPGFTHAPVRS